MNETIMRVNTREYKVLQLLGKGKGGYSYLVTDGKNQRVLKQIHHEPCEYYSFGNKLESELKDYETLSKVGIRMPRLLDYDTKRECILKEYIPGETIFDLVKDNKMQSVWITQVQEMCRLLYPANLNIDYFPTNFIPHEGKLYYIDYECNSYMEEWDFEHWGIRYWSKTPEMDNV